MRVSASPSLVKGEHVKTLLVDGSHLARRNYHGQNLKTSTGVRTGLVYGFINSLLFAQRKVEAHRVYVAWDTAGGSAFRKAILPLYKGNRSVVEPEYLEDLEMLKTVLKALGVCQLSSEVGECDDVIGYLCKALDGEKYILSGDKDFYQLQGPMVILMSTDCEFILSDVEGRLPLREGSKIIWLKPDQITSYKAIRGDASDNIPGAYKFGIAAAIKYFEKNYSVDEFIDGTASVDHLSFGQVTALLQAKPLLEKFKLVATIDPKQGKVDIPTVRPPIDWDLALQLFDYLEFKVYTKMGQEISIIGGM